MQLSLHSSPIPRRYGRVCLLALCLLNFSPIIACETGPALQIKMAAANNNPCQSPSDNPLQAMRVELEIPSLESTDAITSPATDVDLIKRSKQSILGFQGTALQKILRHCAVDIGYQSPTLTVTRITVTFFDRERIATLCGSATPSADLKNSVQIEMRPCAAN